MPPLINIEDDKPTDVIKSIIDTIVGPGKMFDTRITSRAPNHDQRKGQWLLNKIHVKYKCESREQAARILFNIENLEFNELMGDYYD